MHHKHYQTKWKFSFFYYRGCYKIFNWESKNERIGTKKKEKESFEWGRRAGILESSVQSKFNKGILFIIIPYDFNNLVKKI